MAQPIDLRKWSTTVLRDTSSQDNTQITSPATVRAFKRGATVRGNVTIPTGGVSTQMDVYEFGALQPDDDVMVNGDTGVVLRVVSLAVSTTPLLFVKNFGSVAISLVVGDRLTPITTAVTLYSESTGITTKANPTTANGSGYAEFYTREPVFDVRISGTGLATALYQDEEGGQVRPPYYNVWDFPDVQTALSTIPPGARLYFPKIYPSVYKPPTDAGWDLTQPVEIFSDLGPYEVTFMPFSANGVVFNIKDGPYPGGRDVYMHDVLFSWIPNTPGTGDFIRWVPSAANVTIGGWRMDRVQMYYAPRSNVRIEQFSNNYFVGFSGRDCTFQSAEGDGWNVEALANATFSHCSFTRSKLANFRGKGVSNGTIFFACDFEGGCGDNLTDPATEGNVMLENCTLTIQSSNIEAYSLTTTGAVAPVQNGIVMHNCRGCHIINNEFDNTQWNPSPDAASSRCILIKGDGTLPVGGNFILGNTLAAVGISVELLSTGGDGNVIFPFAVYDYSLGSVVKGNMILPTAGKNFVLMNNQDGTSGSPSPSSGAGIIFPNVPGAATGLTIPTTAIGSTTRKDGLLVYDSTAKKFKYWNGTNWMEMTSTVTV